MSTKRDLNKHFYGEEDAYFFERDLEMIKTTRKRRRPKLELIHGGKKDEPQPPRPSTDASLSRSRKKAA